MRTHPHKIHERLTAERHATRREELRPPRADWIGDLICAAAGALFSGWLFATGQLPVLAWVLAVGAYVLLGSAARDDLRGRNRQASRRGRHGGLAERPAERTPRAGARSRIWHFRER
jgi:hypothetical protein